MQFTEFLNTNGLIEGRIPAGEECPFITNCWNKKDMCPSKEKGNLRSDPFSCGLARGKSMVVNMEKEK